MFDLHFFLLTLTQERIYLPKLQFSSSVGYNKFESVTLDILKSRCGASSIEFIFKYTRIIEFLMMQNVFWNNCMPDTSMINRIILFVKVTEMCVQRIPLKNLILVNKA